LAHLAEVFGVRVVRIKRAGVREMSEQLAYAMIVRSQNSRVLFCLLPGFFSIERKGAQ
jgi:hypothetical protein